MLERLSPHAFELTRPAIAVLVFCAFMNFFSRGVSETFAVFLLPVTGELGWTRSTYGTVYFAYMATIGLSAPIIGMIFDRFGPRPVYTAGVCLFGTGFLLASRMEVLWQAILGLGIMTGIGISATGMTVASGLVSRWFERRITLANSLAYTGIPLGMLVVVPLTQVLIEATDWRTAYQVLGIVSLSVVPVIWLLPWTTMGAGASYIQKREVPRKFGLKTGSAAPSCVLGAFCHLVSGFGDHLVGDAADGCLSGLYRIRPTRCSDWVWRRWRIISGWIDLFRLGQRQVWPAKHHDHRIPDVRTWHRVALAFAGFTRIGCDGGICGGFRHIHGVSWPRGFRPCYKALSGKCRSGLWRYQHRPRSWRGSWRLVFRRAF